MMKFLRSQSQTVLIVILGVLALGFLFYGNAGNLLYSGGSRGTNNYGRINGEDLSVADIYDAVRQTKDSLILQGEGQKLRQPGIAPQVAEEAWQRLLLLREADKLHIYVTDQELVDYIRNSPSFQKNGVYSPELYEDWINNIKNVLGSPSDAGGDPVASTKTVVENVLRNDLRIEAVSKALFSSVRTSVRDVSAQYDKYYGLATVSVITFDPKSYIATTKVTPDEIEAEYKAHPEDPAYRTPEKRKVDYVLFALTPEQLKLPDTQKAAAKDALGQQALNFALAFQPEPSADGQNAPTPDFVAEAKKRGLNPVTTDYFTADTPPAGMAPSPSFNNAAFSLTKDNPISRVVELDNGVAVLHLNEIEPSELRPLDEVKAQIIQKLQQADGTQAAQIAAQIASAGLKSDVAKGTDFKAAAKAMKFTATTLPPLVPVNTPSSDPRLQAIAYASMGLSPGQVSDPVPVQSDNTSVIIHLDSRGNADPAGLAAFETHYREAQDQQLRALVSIDWANWKSKQPGTVKPPNLDAFGTVD